MRDREDGRNGGSRPRQRLASTLLALAGVLLVAGCLGPAEGPTSEPSADPPGTAVPISADAADETTNASPEPEEAAGGPELEDHALAYAGEPVRRSVPVEGSFGPADTCLPAGCQAGDDRHVQEVPIHPHVPPDVPVRVSGEVRYDGQPGDLTAQLRTGGAEIYGAQVTAREGTITVDARVAEPAGNMTLAIVGMTADASEELTYEGNLTIRSDADVVPAGVPTRLPLPDDARSLRLAPEDGQGPVRFVLWDEEGQRVARATLEEAPWRYELANGTPRPDGLQIEAPTHGVRVTVTSPQPPEGSLAPLATVPVVGSLHEAPPGEPLAWTFAIPHTPSAVGLATYREGLVSARSGGPPALTVRSPDGTVLDRPSGEPASVDGLGVGGAAEVLHLSPPGAPALVPGDYAFDVAEHRDLGRGVASFALVYENASLPADDEPPDDQGWPPADEARIRPGVNVGLGRCTANFVFRSPDNTTLYIGTSAHCLTGSTIGDRFAIAGIPAAGRLVYCSWGTIETGERSGCPEVENEQEERWDDDFALLAVRPDLRDEVHPAVRHWGGPTALAGPIAQGDRVLVPGNSSLRSHAPDTLDRQRGHVAEHRQRFTYVNLLAPSIPGDSGSPALTADGEALGVVRTLEACGVDHPQRPAHRSTTGVTNLDAALATLQEHTELSVELVTSPLRQEPMFPANPADPMAGPHVCEDREP